MKTREEDLENEKEIHIIRKFRLKSYLYKRHIKGYFSLIIFFSRYLKTREWEFENLSVTKLRVCDWKGVNILHQLYEWKWSLITSVIITINPKSLIWKFHNLKRNQHFTHVSRSALRTRKSTFYISYLNYN